MSMNMWGCILRVLLSCLIVGVAHDFEAVGAGTQASTGDLYIEQRSQQEMEKTIDGTWEQMSQRNRDDSTLDIPQSETLRTILGGLEQQRLYQSCFFIFLVGNISPAY